MYPMLCARPDIAFPASQLDRFAANPLEIYCAALKKLLGYLDSISDYGLVIDTRRQPDILTGYTDATRTRTGEGTKTTDQLGYAFTFASITIS